MCLPCQVFKNGQDYSEDSNDRAPATVIWGRVLIDINFYLAYQCADMKKMQNMYGRDFILHDGIFLWMRWAKARFHQ